MQKDKQLKVLMTMLNMQGGYPCSCGKRHFIVDAERYDETFVIFLCKMTEVPDFNCLLYDLKTMEYWRLLNAFSDQKAFPSNIIVIAEKKVKEILESRE